MPGGATGVRLPVEDEDADQPWTMSPSRRRRHPTVHEPLPERVDIVVADQVYVDRNGLPSPVVAQLLRVAAFQNPEFYRAQAMRLPTYTKPKIISCAELLPRHIGLPRGCLNEAVELLKSYGAEVCIQDERRTGHPLVIASRFISPAYRATSPHFQAAASLGLIDFAHMILMRTPTRISALGFSRQKSVGVFGDREIEIMRLLIPHVRRAVTISNVLDVQAIEKTRMAETLDALRLGVVLANADSRILHANRAAEEMMRDDGPLRDRGGVLRAEGGAASLEIGSAIKQAASNESGIGKTGLAVRLTEEEDEAPVIAHVLPLAGGEVRSRLEPAAVAAVFVNPKVDDAASAQAVAATYGLTPAETRVLRRVLTGSTVAEAAADLGVAASPVSSTDQAHPKAESRGTEVERGGSPADLLRTVLSERPVIQCQHLTNAVQQAAFADCRAATKALAAVDGQAGSRSGLRAEGRRSQDPCPLS